MCSTSNNRLGDLKFRYFLMVVFYQLGHPLKKRLETQKELNMGRCIAGYFDVFPLNIVSSETFTRYKLPALLATRFVDDQMGKVHFRVQTSMDSVMAP
jgi:hypothetical protein